MKCKYFNCPNEAKGNYPACCAEHGTGIKLIANQLKYIFDADDVRTVNPEYNFRKFISVEQVIYYSQFI